MYRTQVYVETRKVSEWIELYCHPETFCALCRDCPRYGCNWSCPPGVPSAKELIGKYRFVQLIGLKVIYDAGMRQESMKGSKQEEALRQKTYGAAKKQMLQALLALEEIIPDSMTVMAGCCELCEECTRAKGKGCRHPEQMRFSFSGLGFDLGRISEEILKLPLLWQKEGLPEYNVAVAAFLHS